jgi:hypothetical protein
LCDVIFRRTGSLAASNLVKGLTGSDVDLRRAELCVVEEEGSLGGRLFLKRNSGGLVRVGLVGLGGDGKTLDLATKEEEVLVRTEQRGAEGSGGERRGAEGTHTRS